MSEIDILIDTPIGALFFVSGALSAFAVIALFVLRKGTETHSVLGYFFLFSLSFFNYASSTATYQGLLPMASTFFSGPISMVSIILGLIVIMPKAKSKTRVCLHVILMITSISAFFFGVVVNWYHFRVSLLNIFQWSDLGSVLVLSMPIFVIAALLGLHYLSYIDNYLQKTSTKKADGQINYSTSRESNAIKSRSNNDIIYKEKKKASESNQVGQRQ